jgi:hypothetical protein
VGEIEIHKVARNEEYADYRQNDFEKTLPIHEPIPGLHSAQDDFIAHCRWVGLNLVGMFFVGTETSREIREVAKACTPERAKPDTAKKPS